MLTRLFHSLLFLPEQASTFAERVDRLHYFVILTTLVASTVVGVSALLLFVRFRRRSEDQRTPRVVPPVAVEVAFIAVPLVFFLAWFTQGYRDFVWVSTPPKEALDVYVLGKQWMWKFSYPEGPNSIGTLRVPVNRPVRLLLTSRDVIHSFYVPSFRLKMDALPGRYTQTWFEATRVGRFQVLCAEYCGLSHSQMWGEIEVLSQEEFDAWLEEQRAVELAERQDARPPGGEGEVGLLAQGRRLSMDRGCLKCHSLDGSPLQGPSWQGLYGRPTQLTSGERVRADEAYLTESMMDPQAKVVAGYLPVMPSFHGVLAEGEVAALLEFIKSLRTREVGAAPTAPGVGGAGP